MSANDRIKLYVEPIKARHVKGSSRYPIHDAMVKYDKVLARKGPCNSELCAEINCSERAQHGAHVTVPGSRKWYIIKTCQGHNPAGTNRPIIIKSGTHFLHTSIVHGRKK